MQTKDLWLNQQGSGHLYYPAKSVTIECPAPGTALVWSFTGCPEWKHLFYFYTEA